MNGDIRFATVDDAAAIAAIYSPFCLNTSISFEEVAPDAAEMARRIERILPRWPWLVFDDGGTVRGYAYAGPHNERAAYRWSVSVAVYVGDGARRQGVGRRLYETLFRLLVVQGYFKAFAGVTLPNPASERLHESVGFTPVGTYHGSGYKFGAWHDVRWYERELQPERAAPPEPTAIGEVVGTNELREAIGM
jgi:phosphinothricin acetyltransferase